MIPMTTHPAPPGAVGGGSAPAIQEAGAQPPLQDTAGEATPSTETFQRLLPREALQEDTEGVLGEAHEKEPEEPRGLTKSVGISLATIIPPGGMLSTVFNIASICVGAGILGLPAASNSSGVVMSIVYAALVGALSVYSLYCLALQMERFGLKTYEGMARTVLGPGFDYATGVLRIVNTFGGSIAFIICVADIFRAILRNANIPEYWKSNSGIRLLTSLVWLTVMLPFVIPRHINSLRYVSTVGVVFVIYFVVMVISHSGMNGLAENVKHITVAGSPADDGIHLFGTGNSAVDGLGVFMFAFTCQVNSFEVYWDMQKRSVGRFTLYSAIAIFLCFILYVLTGIFGYLDFGSRTTVSALLLYDPVKKPAVMVAYVGVMVKLCSSYPLLTMVTRNSLYHTFGWNPDTVPFWRHCIFVIGLALASLLCGLFIPNINTVFGLIGALCGGISGFILPSLLVMYGGNWSLRSAGLMHYTLTYFLLIAGVTMTVFGTGATIHSVVGVH